MVFFFGVRRGLFGARRSFYRPAMSTVRLLYGFAQWALRAATPIAGHGGSKVARHLAGRRRAAAHLAAWGRGARDPDRACVWLHAPSVGEGLQARAVLEALQRRRPELQTLFTHFSPSAEALARGMPADVSGYLPWDLRREMASALDGAAPNAVVFTKTEVWPVLAEAAHARGIPVALIGGTVPPGARRARWPGRVLLRDMWERVARVGAISDADAEGFERLGVPGSALVVTGDPGIDSAAQRSRAADPSAPFLSPFHADPRPTVVAGSTWPADDAVLLPALRAVRDRVPDVRAILAPHEPGAEHVQALLRRLEDDGWRAAPLREIERSGSAGGVDVVVVDRVGSLAHLYTVGRAAYVGGGFHAAGLHSVLEPAAAGLPVVFGPRHANARAAAELLACEGAQVAGDVGGLSECLTRWLSEDDAHAYTAVRALGYIHRHLGASERSATLIDELLT